MLFHIIGPGLVLEDLKRIMPQRRRQGKFPRLMPHQQVFGFQGDQMMKRQSRQQCFPAGTHDHGGTALPQESAYQTQGFGTVGQRVFKIIENNKDIFTGNKIQ